MRNKYSFELLKPLLNRILFPGLSNTPMKVTGMVVGASAVSFLCQEPACQSPITEEQTTPTFGDLQQKLFFSS